jgi:predicted nucleotidyltransferase
LAHTVRFTADGLEVRVLDLPTLISVKAKVGRAKDKLAVAELLALATRE